MSCNQVCYFENSKCATANTKAQLRHNVKLWLANHTLEFKPWFKLSSDYLALRACFPVFGLKRQKFICLHAVATPEV